MNHTPFQLILFVFSFYCFFQNTALAQVDDVSEATFPMLVESNTLKIPIYSSHTISVENTNIEKAIIVIQGSNRNAGPYLENLTMAANNAGVNMEKTLLVSPQFLIEDDIDFHNLDAQHLYWTNGGWKSGANSRDEITNPRPARIPSYAVLDSLLTHLAQQFPNIKSIVLTGHSAGGQVVQRMAATSPIGDLLCQNFGISIHFAPINPSSYVYMDGQRHIPGSNGEFIIPTNTCNDYNDWKYGLYDLYTYPETFGADSIQRMYQRRSVSYLIGEDDNNPNSSSLDDSCPGNLQGAHRYERAEIFYQYLQYYYGTEIITRQEFVSVPNAGHNSFEVFNSPEGRFVLFEKNITSCDSSVGLIPAIKDLNIHLFPNPTSDIINIAIPYPSDDDYKICILDLTGRLLMNQNLESNIVNISDLANGSYLLLLQGKESRVYKKFVVQK